ncbi:MAG: hypothetical protein JRJ84_25615, partial [Deltaproteobacteria bacterium]|nr:hypothetical protein [Deltaproteobacteria bacterium]
EPSDATVVETYTPLASQDTLEARMADADLVFLGEVVRIDYRESLADGADGMALPHTFATYRIIDPITGGTAGEEITLRFLGGPNEQGNTLVVSDLPRIDVGDTDMVFVRGNGESICPLVDCSKGRFRVVDGIVYTEDGHELHLLPSGAIRRGPWHDLAQVRTQTIGDLELEVRPSPIEEAGDSALVMPTDPTARALVVEPLQDQLALAATAFPRVPSATALGVSPDQPFSVHLAPTAR